MPTDTETHAYRSRFSLSVFTAIQIVLSFSIQWYAAYRLGAGHQIDALYAALTLPQLISAFAFDSLRAILVPWWASQPRAEQTRSQFSLLITVGGLALVTAAVVIAIAPLSQKVLAPGFDAATSRLSVDLLRIVGLIVPGAALFAVLAAYDQARGRFARVALASVVSTALAFGLLVFGLERGGIHLVAWAQVVALGGPAIFLVSSVARPSAFDPAFGRELWRRLRVVYMGTAVVRSGFVVDRLLASFLAPGSITLLDLTQRIHGAIVRTLNQGVVTPVVPSLAVSAHRPGRAEFHRMSRRTRDRILVISAIVVLLILVGIGAGRFWSNGFGPEESFGAFDAPTLRMFFQLLALVSGITLFGGAVHAWTSTFYAADDAMSPTKAAVIAFAVGLVFKLLGFWWGGVLGLAASISVQYAVHWILLEQRARGQRSRDHEPIVPVAPTVAR